MFAFILLLWEWGFRGQVEIDAKEHASVRACCTAYFWGVLVSFLGEYNAWCSEEAGWEE